MSRNRRRTVALRSWALGLGIFFGMLPGVAPAQLAPVALQQFDVSTPGSEVRSISFGARRVDYRLVFNGRSAGVDVVGITPNTTFAVDFGIECTGEIFGGAAAVNRSPLSRRDDTFARCPRGSRPLRVFGAIGIVERF